MGSVSGGGGGLGGGGWGGGGLGGGGGGGLGGGGSLGVCGYNIICSCVRSSWVPSNHTSHTLLSSTTVTDKTVNWANKRSAGVFSRVRDMALCTSKSKPLKCMLGGAHPWVLAGGCL
jgi:hypothetical protein